MKKVKITVVRKAFYADLSARYENPDVEPCCMEEGMTFISENGEIPACFCANAWTSVEPFARELALGGGNFFDGWMKNERSAVVSCNDGVRPVSFYLEAE